MLQVQNGVRTDVHRREGRAHHHNETVVYDELVDSKYNWKWYVLFGVARAPVQVSCKVRAIL